MVLELYQNDRFISSVVLKYYSILDTNPKKQGYSATIIPGLTHSYKLANICILNFIFSIFFNYINNFREWKPEIKMCQ